jgi:hypothetical protein
MFVDQLIEHSPESLEASAISFESLLSTLYPITYSCYMSGFEFADVTKMYIATFSSAERVLYNLMHKVGQIYDTIWSIRQNHELHDALTLTEEGRTLWWYKTGSYYGLLFMLLFYTD